MAAAIAGFGSAAHANDYSEINGDFSNNSSAPSLVHFTPGSNIISGTTGGFDSDYLTFTIPAGEDLSSIVVLDGSQAPDRIFFGIASGDAVTATLTSAVGLLGYTLFSNAMDNTDVLPALGLSEPANFPYQFFPGATGFTAPLGAGDYATWVVDGDGDPGTAPYKLDFVVSAAPEPSTWALMLLGVGGVGFAFRQASKRGEFTFTRRLSA